MAIEALREELDKKNQENEELLEAVRDMEYQIN
jgi:hypothetical protein